MRCHWPLQVKAARKHAAAVHVCPITLLEKPEPLFLHHLKTVTTEHSLNDTKMLCNILDLGVPFVSLYDDASPVLVFK